jgi:hypothetical protein
MDMSKFMNYVDLRNKLNVIGSLTVEMEVKLKSGWLYGFLKTLN